MYLLGYDVGSSSVKASLVSVRDRQVRGHRLLSEERGAHHVQAARLRRTGPGHVVGQPQTRHRRHPGAGPQQGHPPEQGLLPRRHQGHRHLLPDARPRVRGQGPQCAASVHHLVRLPRRSLRQQGLRGTGRRLVPGPPAEQSRQLHRRETRLGEAERARPVRAHQPPPRNSPG